MKKFITLLAVLASSNLAIQAQSINRLIADSTSTRAAYPVNFTKVGNKIMFAAKHETNTNSYALYQTDGTDAGTVMVSSLSDYSVAPSSFIALGNLLFFQNYSNGKNEPWVSDGTDVGTKSIKDWKPELASSGFNPIRVLGGFLYFHASPAGVQGLWKTDGTAAGTTEVKSNTTSYNSIVFNNKIYFWGSSNNLFGLYSVDASANVQLVKQLKSSNNYGAQIAVASSKFYFAFNDSIAGVEPWVSDGTTSGTFMLKDIMVGSGSSMDMGGSSSYSTLAILNDKLYFNPANGSGRAIWTSDGTTSGTVMVTSTAGTNPQSFGVANNTLFFVKDNPSRIGVSNGTESGTRMLSPTSNTNGLNTFGRFLSYNNKVIFGGVMIGREDIGPEPWISDGADEGTFMIKDINPKPYATSLNSSITAWDYAELNGKLYLSCNDGVDSKVWVIDFGGSGTGLVNLSDNTSSVVKSYPNPVVSQLTVDLNEPFTYRVFDVTGKCVCNGKSSVSINVEALESGMYWLSIQTESGKRYQSKISKIN